MSLTINEICEYLVPYAKEQDPKKASDRATLAHLAIYTKIFKDDGAPYYLDLVKRIDKKLNKTLSSTKGDFIDKELLEYGFRKPFRMDTLHSNLEILQNLDRDHDYMTPMAIEIFELFTEGHVDEAMEKVRQLPVDYPFESRLEGQLLLLLAAIRDEEWDVVKSILARASISAQMIEDIFSYQTLLGEIVRRFIPHEHRPWMMMQLREEVVDGVTYYCQPAMVSTYSIVKQYKVHQTPIKPLDIKQYNAFDYIPRYRDSYGNEFVGTASAMGAFTANAVKGTIDAIGNVTHMALQSIIKYAQKGKYTIFIGPGCKTNIKTRKDTLLPLGSCGYVVSRDKSVFEKWQDAIASGNVSADTVSKFEGFYNLVDNSFYPVYGESIPEELKTSLAVIK